MQWLLDGSASVGRFAWRHKGKIALVVVVAGSAYAVRTWSGSRLEEWQRTYMLEQHDAHLKAAHFERVMENSDHIVLAGFVPGLQATVLKLVPVEEAKSRFAKIKSMVREKQMETWDDLRCLHFARPLCGMYSVALFNVMYRVGTTILARYQVNDLVRGRGAGGEGQDAEAEPAQVAYSVAQATQELYLGFVTHMASGEGMRALCAYVEERVRAGLQGLRLNGVVRSHNEIFVLLGQLRQAIEGESGSKDLLACLLPTKNAVLESDAGDAAEQQECLTWLCDETRDVVDSEAFAHTIQSVLNVAYHLLEEQLQESVSFHVSKQLQRGQGSSSASASASASEVSTDAVDELDLDRPQWSIKVPMLLPLVEAQFGRLLEPQRTEAFIQHVYVMQAVEQMLESIYRAPIDLVGEREAAKAEAAHQASGWWSWLSSSSA